MTADELDWDDDLPPETEAEVYQALLRALRRKQGFGLFFVQCTESQGEKLVTNLRRDLPKQTIQEMPLQGEVTALYDQVATLWQQHPFDVLVVQGLQASLYAYEDTKRLSGWSSSDIYNYSWKGVPKILNHLNQQRDRFRDDFPARFVFLMPPFVVDYFIQRAADFLDWRSGLFRFPRDPNEIAQDAKRILASGGYSEYLSLTPRGRIKKILELKTLQEDCPDLDRKANLLFELGLLFDAEQDYENAVTSYDKAIEINPNFYQAWHNRGLSLSDLGRTREAIESFDKALQIKPSYHKALYSRGLLALNDLGRKNEAIESYDKVWPIKPAGYEALQIKPDGYEFWYNQGVTFNGLGYKEKAITSFDKAIEIKSDYHEAWLNRGNALSDLGRKEEAITSYDQALHIKPDDHEAWLNRGIALSDLGRYEEAIASWDKAITFKPDYHKAWNNRGNALTALGRYEESINNYDQAIKIRSDDANVYYNKACCYGLQGKVELAVETLQIAIDFDAECREWAQTDTDFDAIREDEQFRALLEG